jgi:hypothetical protein
MADRQVTPVFRDVGMIVGDPLLDPSRLLECRQGPDRDPFLKPYYADAVMALGQGALVIYRVEMGRDQLRRDRDSLL